MTQIAAFGRRLQDAVADPSAEARVGAVQTEAPRASLSPLARTLVTELREHGIRHCQWKGLRRTGWAWGESDLDLLIDRESAQTFAQLMDRLGFRLVQGARPLPGVESRLGHEPACSRPLHIHVHHQLFIGPLWKRCYRLPIEREVLENALPGQPFPVPSPEYQLLLYVLRATLQQPSRGAAARRLREEFAMLEGVVRRSEVVRAVQSVPRLDIALYDRCVSSFSTLCPVWRRVAIRIELERRLSAFGRGSRSAAAARAAVRRVAHAVRPPCEAEKGSKHPAAGGAIIALVGSDGSGKSTCARILHAWLGSELEVRHQHFGLPPRSILTFAAGALLKLTERLRRSLPAQVVAHAELLRSVGTARDRRRLARRARRFAVRGGIVICERFPVPQNRALAGPSRAQGIARDARSRFADWLRRYEESCYERIGSPDRLIFLRIEPEQAVARKTDEPAAYVRRRARLLLDADWSGANAIVIDAARPLADVVAELKARIWETL